MTGLRVGVGILGAGAIGCYVGGVLAAEGLDVVFVGRPRAKECVEAEGLALTDLDGGVHTVSPARFVLATDASALAACDVVLCCVKSAQTEGAARELAPVLREGAVVVSLQNGVRNADVLRRELPGRSVLGGIVSFNVVGTSASTYRRTTTGPVLVEATDDPRVVAMLDALERGGLEAALTRDIRGSQWTKLIINLMNAVGALSDVPTSQLLLSKGYRRVMALLMSEALRVMEKAGVRPGKLGRLPVSAFPAVLSLPTPVLRLVLRAQLKVDPEARSSMWQDLSKQRSTEVDYLNGEVVRLASSCGASAPANQRVVECVRAAENAGLGSPRMSADVLFAALTAPGSLS